MKISVTIDEKKYKSILKINETLIFTKKGFFYTILGFTRAHSYPLNDIDSFYQLIPGSYRRMDFGKVHLKCDCFDGSIFHGVREPILYSFALD